MLNKAIPFEIHITTDKIPPNLQSDFVEFCLSKEAKPLMIELAKGAFMTQPMLSKVIHSNSLEDILSIASEIANSMNSQNFLAKRLKIEIPSENADLMQGYASNFESYFEWHCKINYIQADKLLELCEKHKAHLSLNSLKNEANTRFITLREFGEKQKFEQRTTSLLYDLQNGSWEVLKQQSEFCIYDNNQFLDHGWLPQ